jgi:capsular polysaccharide biosynthesis protein
VNRYGWLRTSHFQWLRRRWWLLVLCPVIAGACTMALKPAPRTTYRATAVVVVNSCQGTNCPGSANEANALATTYAGLIPVDQSVLSFVSRRLSPALPAAEPLPDIGHQVSVTQVSSTSLLNLQFSDATEQRAVSGANALAAAVTSNPSATSAVPTGAVTLVQTAVSAAASQNVPGALVPISVVLGLLLAFLLVFVFERIDMRIDTPAQLAMLLGCRVTDIDGESVVGALRVWQGITSEPPAIVGLVPLGAESKADVSTDTTAQQIGADAAAAYVDVRLAHLDELASVTQLPGAALILVPLEATEVIDPAQIDAIVAVVAYGEPLRDVRRQADQFRSYGKAPIWALITRPEHLVPVAAPARPSGLLSQSSKPRKTKAAGSFVGGPNYDVIEGDKALP